MIVPSALSVRPEPLGPLAVGQGGATPLGRSSDSPLGFGGLRVGAANPARSAAATTAGANSSPVREVGSVIATIPTDAGPAQAFYDPGSGYVLVADQNANTVMVLNGTLAIASIPVGVGPLAVAYDSLAREVYVGNTGSDNLTVFSGAAAVASVTTAFDTSALVIDPVSDFLYAASNSGSSVEVIQNRTVIGAVQVGSSPKAFAYDALDGYVYLANERSGNVSVINGTQLVATIPVGAFPESLAYDPADGEVYVANYVSSTVSVLRGTTVTATVTVGQNPVAVVVDPRSGEVYVCGSGNDSVAVLQGESVRAWISTTSGPTGGIYGAATGYLYFTSVNGQSVTVVNGTNRIGVIPVRSGPEGAAADPQTGDVYVPNYGADNVSVISTILAESSLSLRPPGDPAQSADVGQPVEFDATLWAIGTGTVTPSAGTSPSIGTGCGRAVGTTRYGGQVQLKLDCVPTAPGSYTVWINVSDSALSAVWANDSLQVFADPIAGGLTAIVGSQADAYSADVSEPFRFLEVPSGGTGTYASFDWTGLPPGECSAESSSSPRCVLGSPTNLSVRVTVTDSNGASAMSGGLAFRIVALPVAGEPLSSRPSADVGQLLTFATVASSGSGGYTFNWSGLPDGCMDSHQARQTCQASSFGSLRVGCVVTDSNGGVSAPSTTTLVTIFPDPVVSTPVLSAAQVSAGSTVTFETSAAGGSGGFNYSWQGLPEGCAVSESIVTCSPERVGTYSVSVVLNDSNGFSVRSPPVTLEVTAPPSPWTAATTAATYALVAAIAVLGALALYALVRSRRPPRSSEGPAGPPTVAEETAPSR